MVVARVAGAHSLSEYERLRLEKIKSNAEQMQAAGAEFLTTKILEKTQGFNLPSGKLNETFIRI
ncbi:hypothetical protein Leryth_010700 [Lithospermum erythrorhizon]|nr:hypothetical protein Leryth_010700 [Lithospermum erythrorhizon]